MGLCSFCCRTEKVDWTATFRAVAVILLAFCGLGIHISWSSICIHVLEKESNSESANIGECLYTPWTITSGQLLVNAVQLQDFDPEETSIEDEPTPAPLEEVKTPSPVDAMEETLEGAGSIMQKTGKEVFKADNYFKENQHGNKAVSYILMYSWLTILGLMGIIALLCGQPFWSKIYAALLVLTLCGFFVLEFLTLARISEFFKDVGADDYSSEKVNKVIGDKLGVSSKETYYMFLQIFMLFAETCVLLSAAHDAYDRSDVEKKDEDDPDEVPLRIDAQVRGGRQDRF